MSESAISLEEVMTALCRRALGDARRDPTVRNYQVTETIRAYLNQRVKEPAKSQSAADVCQYCGNEDGCECITSKPVRCPVRGCEALDTCSHYSSHQQVMSGNDRCDGGGIRCQPCVVVESAADLYVCPDATSCGRYCYGGHHVPHRGIDPCQLVALGPCPACVPVVEATRMMTSEDFKKYMQQIVAWAEAYDQEVEMSENE